MNPSPSFTSLLHSQSAVDLESAELPWLSSQSSDASSVNNRRKWTPTEDVILISAWLNTSKDPIISNEQKAGAFWKRIADYFNSNSLMAEAPPRESVQCKQRWGRINEQVCKFVGCYDAALKEQRSGQNDNDVMKLALDLFNNDSGHKFTMEHAWRELRHDQKWCSTYVDKDTSKEKRKPTTEDNGQEEVVVEEQESRPIGVKAAKAANKRKKGGKEEELSKLQEMLELKEKIAKHGLLKSLLEKREPLSEIEQTLKLKLMAEMI